MTLNADPEAVAVLVDGCEWLDGALAAIVEAGVRSGAFADPRAGRTWSAPWRAAHARQTLVWRAFVRRCPEFPPPVAHSAPALLEVLATLSIEPGGPSLLALVSEGGASRRPVWMLGPARTERARSERRAPAPSPGVKPVVQLLVDVRAVFEAEGDPARIASAVLDEALHALPERPWAAMPKTGKPITAQARGRLLAAVGIRTKMLEFDGRGAKGYERTGFKAAWSALL